MGALGGYDDRTQAGQVLAARLAHLRSRDPLVLALPRGGVVVGAEVARALGAPLEIVSVRKVGAPFQPELAVGAVVAGPGGRVWIDDRALRRLGLSAHDLAEDIQREQAEAQRRLRDYQPGHQPSSLRGRTVILVDDGIATGWSMRAALEAVRSSAPAYVVLAVPVAPPDTLEDLRPLVDEIVCPLAPPDFQAVGQFYRDFAQVSDEEVRCLLAGASSPPVDGDQGTPRDAVSR